MNLNSDKKRTRENDELKHFEYTSPVITSLRQMPHARSIVDRMYSALQAAWHLIQMYPNATSSMTYFIPNMHKIVQTTLFPVDIFQPWEMFRCKQECERILVWLDIPPLKDDDFFSQFFNRRIHSTRWYLDRFVLDSNMIAPNSKNAPNTFGENKLLSALLLGVVRQCVFQDVNVLCILELLDHVPPEYYFNAAICDSR